jgi:hypothetical protein
MKTINPPLSIWINGVYIETTIFQLQCNFDNLIDTAVFYFARYDRNVVKITDGNITMSGTDYLTDWVTNDAAYNWAAQKLGITITGNYEPTV